MSIHATSIEIEFLNLYSSSRDDSDAFDKLLKSIKTDYKPPHNPAIKPLPPQPSVVQGANYVNRAEQIAPPQRGTQSSTPVTTNAGPSEPFDYSALGELFINNPAIPAPPGGTNVGQAAQTRPVNQPQFQVPPALMFALTKLLGGAQ